MISSVVYDTLCHVQNSGATPTYTVVIMITVSCAQIPGNHAPRKKWWDATLEVSWLGWGTGYPLFVGDGTLTPFFVRRLIIESCQFTKAILVSGCQ